MAKPGFIRADGASAAADLLFDLADWLGPELPPTVIVKMPSVETAG